MFALYTTLICDLDHHQNLVHTSQLFEKTKYLSGILLIAIDFCIRIQNQMWYLNQNNQD
jgi:hypothetical protein